MKDRVTEYAQAVVADKIPYVGHLHHKACERHLKDLARQGTKDFPYVWKPELSERVLECAETMTIAEGREPTPLKLYGFQCFDIGSLFGWVHMNTKFRRFRVSYKSMARQNGKTFQNGILAIYISAFSGYNYGKLFTVATKQAQAKLAWEEMQKFIEIDPDLERYFRVQEYKNLITCKTTKCTIEALSKERSLDDGFRGIFASIDEIHQHKDNQIYKTMKNGTRNLDETLLSMITTRGFNTDSFCYEFDSLAISILEGSFSDETTFVDIYALDKNDDMWLPENQYKANPLLCQTEKGRKNIADESRLAKEAGGMELRDFMVKSLNLWSRLADNIYIEDIDKFLACGTEKTLENFRGSICTIGLDLSEGGDLTTVNIEIEFKEKDRTKYFMHSHSFLPLGRLQEHIQSDLAPYDMWEKDGLLTTTGGENSFKNDYKFIVRYIKDIVEKYDLKIDTIAYDPHNADGVLADLEEFGSPLLMVAQSARNLNDATKDIINLYKSKLLEYNKNNALFVWSFSHAKIVANSFGEIKVDK